MTHLFEHAKPASTSFAHSFTKRSFRTLQTMPSGAEHTQLVYTVLDSTQSQHEGPHCAQPVSAIILSLRKTAKWWCCIGLLHMTRHREYPPASPLHDVYTFSFCCVRPNPMTLMFGAIRPHLLGSTDYDAFACWTDAIAIEAQHFVWDLDEIVGDVLVLPTQLPEFPL